MATPNNKFFKYLLDKEYEKRNYKKRTMQNHDFYKKLCIDTSYNITWKDYINYNIDVSFSNIK